VAAASAESTQATLLAVADGQLYEAKRAGRNRVRMSVRPTRAISPRA
jgi:PleD family two-component response regulator